LSYIELLKAKYRNAIDEKRCSEKNCKLRLDGLDSSNYVIFKGEEMRDIFENVVCFCNHDICDCIIFVNFSLHIKIVLVELKSGGGFSLSSIRRKLENCTGIAKHILDEDLEVMEYEFFHIALAGNWGRKAKLLKSPEYKISFRNIKYTILPVSCGYSLSKLLA
jgi:hypothetical protein